MRRCPRIPGASLALTPVVLLGWTLSNHELTIFFHREGRFTIRPILNTDFLIPDLWGARCRGAWQRSLEEIWPRFHKPYTGPEESAA